MRHDLVKMLARIKKALAMPEAKARITRDFAAVLEAMGFKQRHVTDAVNTTLKGLIEANDLMVAEQGIYGVLTALSAGFHLAPLLEMKLKDRAEIIYTQVAHYFVSVEGRVIDYGCGDGQVTARLLQRGVVDEIVGYDIRAYKGAVSNTVAKIKRFEGRTVPEKEGSFSAALMTNVLHHAEPNQHVLDDLRRLLKSGGKLVVIETCPEKDTPEDLEVTFLNDYLYNRIFHPFDDIPVPGTFETAEGWTKRFEASGFKQVSMQVLGYDQPLIRDWHVLYELERV